MNTKKKMLRRKLKYKATRQVRCWSFEVKDTKCQFDDERNDVSL